MSVKYDVVVAGAGNAALCAAISARETGLSVLVLEKAPKHKRGGNSYFTDGAIRFAYNGIDDIRKIIPEMTDEEAAKINMPSYHVDDYYNDLMRVNNNKSDPSLARQLVSRSFETITWMHSHGISFELNYKNQSFEGDGKFHFWGGLPVKTHNIGMGLIKSLNKRAEELGIDIWYEARALDIKKENDRITAIEVEKGGQIVSIPVHSVILACGGFEANKEMRAKHIGPEWEAAIVRGTEYNTGDGLQIALKAGAARHGDWSGCHSIGTDYNAPKVGDFSKPGDIFKKHSYPLGLLINRDGERFVDEGADFRNYTYAKYGREILKQPGAMAFQVYDQQVRPLLREEYDLEEATAFQADSVEELADMIDVNKEAFLKTIAEYNNAVQDGSFHPNEKDGKGTRGIHPPKSNWALKLDQAPYYAFPVTCGITFSFGGLLASIDAEVLTADATPINGLFAAGEMIGGLFYDNYPGGSGLMSGAVFGKLAGKSASRYVKTIKTEETTL
ncbi:FAD-dependent tricarballylate dehydrogenase TcuA [Alkalihalobacillus oceani]|uniref:FAD-dependent tricarballylate dehydrogenase TcuA n=1 Tax=Halalkalibacter oceani TaxID=1653776 RepID=A0A9X2IR28_9BACI|nr:FAD-dependent tricarballylate dehydrogenase TcuA [Halalkalibacter oceani]MCM3716496.1 FAD-dependent tricarballylate dehydrogenase TcuA [Halalkalibacter oceani]